MSRLTALLERVLGGAVATATARSRKLPLSMQRQLQTNWCWAACAGTASSFYDQASRWGQCRIVNAELTQTACCTDGASAACNRPWYLNKALERTGNLASWSAGAASWQIVRRELDKGRPVGARIGWSGGGGHFVFLTGYSTGRDGNQVHVEDPWTGSSTVPLATFTTAYKGSGTWTHTYLTQA